MARGRPVTVRTSGTRLVGADDIRRKLAALEVGLRDRVVAEGLAAGAEVLRRGAAARASDHSALAAAVASKIFTAKDGRAMALVGIDKSFGPAGRRGFFVSLAYWREFGTKAHRIDAGKFTKIKTTRGERERGAGRTKPKSDKRALAAPGFGPVTSTPHPGTTARPFLRPTWQQDSPRALAVVAQTIAARIRAIVGAR